MEREEILDRITRSLLSEDFRKSRTLNSLAPRTEANSQNLKSVQSGTTILAFKFDGGVFMAADRRTLSGYEIVSQNTIKIHQVGPYTAVGFAGLVSDGQDMVDYLEVINGGFLRNFQIPLTIRAQAQNVASICRNHSRYGTPYENEFIICGFNFYGEFEIFHIGFGGSLQEVKRTSIGSGGQHAVIKLDEEKQRIEKEDLNLAEAVLVSFRALHTAGEYDVGTSPVAMVLPTMAVVKKGGFEFVDEGIIAHTRDLVLKGGARG